jgi:predicted alpha/beta superfamily hydrolase
VRRSAGFTVEPARTLQAPGYPWPHEVRVALPAAYGSDDADFPVLWVTDNALEEALPALGELELVVVSVGPPRGVTPFEWCERRIYDFYPLEDFYPSGVRGNVMRTRDADACPPGRPWRGGGASEFLRFLVENVRPALAAEYRLDASDQTLEGYSAGGWFVLYALFTRPDAFARYVAATPAVSFCHGLLLELEGRYAAGHADLPAELVVGLGEREMTEDSILGCFSSAAQLVELLTFRGYPALRLAVEMLPGETHETARAPTLARAARRLWPVTTRAPQR